jgi:hypothetical protein
MEEENIEAVGGPLLSSKPSIQGTLKKNKYALGCSVLASMTSILMGYRKFSNF